MNKEKVFVHLVKAGRDAYHLEQKLNGLGYRETPYFNLYGEISEAMYHMLGEKTDSFEESITHAAVHDMLTTDEECAEHLAGLCEHDAEMIQIPEATKRTIVETAEARGMEPFTLVKIILSEWAAKQEFLKAYTE